MYSEMWNKLFNSPRNNACDRNKILSRIKKELADDDGGISSKSFSGKSKFSWVKHWGYGNAAYFFDFLDPILRKQIVDTFRQFVDGVKQFPQTDSNIPDLLDYKKILKENRQSLSKKILLRLKKFTKNYDEQIYSASANLPQIQAALQKWKWAVNPDDPSYFMNLIINYDMNYDGRLNPRELLLASIHGFQQIVGSPLCDMCFFDIGKTLDAIFLYLDCNNDGFLSAEELWKNLPKVKRDTGKWNIFAFGNNESIRTSSINDFILKNTKQKDGKLSKREFRIGILLGYWDRQTDKTKVLEGDNRSLKGLRWKDADMIDIAMYNYNKKRMLAKNDNEDE